MADHPDHLLPGLHFLPAQFGSELAYQQQVMRTAVELERAPREVIDLFVVLVTLHAIFAFRLHREQAVATAADGVAQFHRQLLEHVFHALAFQLPAAVQQLACGQVGEHHAGNAIATGGDQQHRHRGVLHHGVQQQFALHQALALCAQHFAQFAVCLHQVTQFVIAGPVDAEVVLTVAVAAGGARQRPHQRAHRCGGAAQRPPHQ
ncbi:hypothetical protein D3C71_1464860 [compost metagenome]